jgi:uncharacterized protein (DUF4415 family)
VKKKNTKPVWHDPDDAPELTDEILDRAEIAIGDVVLRPANGTLTKPGRPKKADAKKSVHLRLSPDVLSYFRKTGPGWQTRIDETLRRAAKLPLKARAARRPSRSGR